MKAPKEEPKTTYNLREAGKELGISASTVLRRIKDGQLKTELNGGRRWVIYANELEIYRRKRQRWAEK